MTTPHQTNDTGSSSTDTAQVTHALLDRLDRTDRALRRWRLAAQMCAGAIIFGAGIAAGSAQSSKDSPQQRQGQPASSQGKSSQQVPDAQDPSAPGAAPAAAPPAPQAQGAARSGSRMVGIALDLNPSGQWNSTLLAVDEDGIVYALNTAGPKATWQRFRFSP